MKQKLLFTPGPLNTSRTVKEAMLRDLGSRDREFIGLVRDIRHQLLALAGVSQASGYEAVLIQGSGTFGVESVLSSVIPAEGKALFLVNGAYGERMVRIAARHRIVHEVLRWAENEPLSVDAVRSQLEADAGITHVAAVHCETTTGILNPITPLGAVVHQFGRTLIVDAMSSFGAIPVDMAADRIDFLVSSANKCLQGVPGFAFALARRDKLEQSKATARTLSLDLFEQWRGLEADGQFRFTPPTHALLAFAQALEELQQEGGRAGRGLRYNSNHQILLAGMKDMGFVPYLDAAHQSVIITGFYYPNHPNFLFEEFYTRLSDHGVVIYPGKLSKIECFRLGNIGHLFKEDIRTLLNAIAVVLKEMGISLPVPPPASAASRG